MKTIRIPINSIVLIIGPSNSGKSSLLSKWITSGEIKDSEVVSSDQFRTLVSDIDFLDWTQQPRDVAENLQETYHAISNQAFQMMEQVIASRARLNKRTFVDATHLREDEREKYRVLAKKFHVPLIAIVLDVSLDVLLDRDNTRTNPRGRGKVKRQFEVLKKDMRFIKKESFHALYQIKEDWQEIKIEAIHPSNELDVGNGLDIIGDIHGCMDEFYTLIDKLGYKKNADGLYIHPEGRKLVSVGDIMSRGPKSQEALVFFSTHIKANAAYMVDSNHGWKIARWLNGQNVTLAHGDEWVEKAFEVLSKENEKNARDVKEQWKDILLQAPSHYLLKRNGVTTAVVVHAGIQDTYIGKSSQSISDFARYGETLGMDENGKPIRGDWYAKHRSKELIIWGHDPKPQPLLINNTFNIDQGVVFGGNLTALRYPERKIVSVPAKQDYAKVENNPLREWQRKRLALPNLASFIEGCSVLTEHGEIKCPKSMIIAAMDKISHYTLPIEELIYIPPTMSPPPTRSIVDGYLEHPRDAFLYYQKNGIEKMIVEKKHMGSRGILLLFKDKATAKHYIGKESLGYIYTRTGRRFFAPEIEQEILSILYTDLQRVGYFTENETDWLLLDSEILPWNLKAKELIINQYAHVAEMSLLDRRKVVERLEEAGRRGIDVDSWLYEYKNKLKNADSFREVYNQYCWDINGIDDIKIAPFHVLAHSNQTFFDQTHEWHMKQNCYFSRISQLFLETDYMVVTDEITLEKAINWWEDLTQNGHEGVIFKPEHFVAKSSKGKLIQPALKVRGKKYLQIIYGMDYWENEQFDRLKNRQTGKKQRNALKEFMLGMEGVHRFIQLESVERIHECVLTTLALEEEPIDARL